MSSASVSNTDSTGISISTGISTGTGISTPATASRSLHLPKRYLEIVQGILSRYLPQAEVWAYGSRVNGDCYEASDLDLVVRQPDAPNQPQRNLDEVAAAFSESDLPILVQILDWARIPAAFREEIEAGYVVLQTAERR